MSNEWFPNLFDKSAAVPAAVVKANKLVVANVEKLVGLQIASLQYYADLGLARLKSAAEVGSAKEWQEFVNGQARVVASVNQRVVEDTKALVDLGVAAGAEYEALINDVVETAPNAFKAVAEKVVEETEKATGEKAA